MRRLRRTRSGSRGGAMVEFALAFVFLLPLFYGTFQFGLGFFYYNELASAVRAGARYASYRKYDSNSHFPSAGYALAVQQMTACGDPRGCLRPVVPGLTPGHIDVRIEFVAGVPGLVTVSIRDFPLNVVFKTYKLSKPSTTFPYLGVYAPAV